MRHTLRDETKSETRALGLIALVCYSATFAGMLAFSYSTLTLALEAAARDLAALLSTAGM